jgi:enterochelin esterase family protein
VDSFAAGRAPDGGGVRLRLADRHRRLAGVRLVAEFAVEQPLDFARAPGGWLLELAQPPVTRLEYLLELTDHNGHRWTIPDPGNPLQAPGAFGAKSVLRFAGYREPAWLSWPRVPDRVRPVEIDAPALGGPVVGELWTPADLPDERPAPLLVVHDGPEYAALGGFTAYLAAAVGRGVVPPLRAALLGPTDRNGWYSANEQYSAALAERVLPELPPAGVRVGVGVSLGALAMLHAHRYCRFDALLLQSGSFFTPELDPQEQGFSGFAAVSSFVAALPQLGTVPVPAALTCGAVEENLANNRAMAGVLRGLGYQAHLAEVADAHNFTAWRDALHPHLTDLLARLAAHDAA